MPFILPTPLILFLTPYKICISFGDSIWNWTTSYGGHPSGRLILPLLKIIPCLMFLI